MPNPESKRAPAEGADVYQILIINATSEWMCL